MQAFSLFLVVAMGLGEESLTRESYLDLIARYRRDELDLGAVRPVLASKHDLQRIVDGLTRHPVERMDGKAAVLLHTEGAFLNRDPGDESARDLHMDLAEKILLELVDDLDFERRWRLAAGFFYQSSLSPGRALHHLEAARILDPSAAETYMAIAMVHEAMGALALSTLPRWDVSAFDRSRRDSERIQLSSRDGRLRLFQAIEQYSKVLQRSPQSAAAHLRRGRCFQLLSLRNEAAEELERALELEPSEYDGDQVLETARKSEAPVFSVTAGDPESSRLNRVFLRRLSDLSGGESYEARSTEQLAGIFQEVLAKAKTRYVLTFVPKDPQPGWHSLRIEVKRRRAEVRARRGYYYRPELRER